MSDLISRQATIEGVKTLHDVAWKNWHEPTLSANVVLDMIRELPSVQPRNGKWTRHFDGNEWYWYCSLCKEQWYEEDLWDGSRFFCYGNHRVEAWMPIPEPYKGEEE